MGEAIATSSRTSWLRAAAVAAAVWVVATLAVVLLAPTLVSLPLPPIAAIAAAACLVLGFSLARLFARFTSPTRVGVAVVVMGQILDVVLIAAYGGRYPGVDEVGTAFIATVLLGGYGTFLLGSVAANVSFARAHRMVDSD